ncbi:MAG: 2-succinyl-5-enolpyruvyl-6-hydroxy-3-cyclohexene-1-carboxylic-acid synthase [Microbacterium sp. SCN 70-200]|uniref:2-succinyl-5-enolpyruvyl-6-hydroxy-3- cyclohexene-1-carboxylic-acid synthase n=1 Tax=unclassified Microbacterium TaxID=2609290 RepID=UPI00086A3FBE|nr:MULTISPECIES: 2-succinyl-5-enolpyruvyl-6-hydroxy-3-cyclohexene-1-carboxylic-acid synthase [unclassified Microbacterium]MBN9215679.1 2-succinyl-5-enolpyruvyl-6-hydroxy-3-cyclohexene-1-carboxylic-acid synthase [Microbacterium sp.]ODT41292.1 MAG: 2-succinyl-5-enolpyruvyl-6-hydroxy-3-cyclohexene-1-carboxylic-acid synthase [Microbacterium sp. SCN 70-200]OJV81729.1 MAG: 2-succinyl-5-enolpyruvyl-6-hydroxy-3-cyclohexene-1-carboxylic-acid synthase [Microbacterium sp. 70-16]
MTHAHDSAPATDAAAALLGRLVELGVRHLVVSPGSRSQALALVAAELEARGSASVHVRIDERVAGFTALGIGRESRMPAAVICTSGTAVANLLPAALEAHHAGIPMLLLTADRPPELRGVGANQTTRQPGLFAPSMRLEADLPVPEVVDPDGSGEQSAMLRRVAEEAVEAALGAGTRQAGPVHLNLPLREPLAGALPRWLGEPTVQLVHTGPGPDDAPAEDIPAPEPSGALYQGGGGIGESNVPTDPELDPHVLERGPRTVVVAGADASGAAEALAHAGGWPLVAEIVSGARYGRNLVHGYRGLLADPELGGRIERAIVFGHPTLSREVTALLSREDVEVFAVRGPGEPLNLNGATTAVDAVVAAVGDLDRDWFGAWMRASRAASVDLAPAAPDAEGLASAVPAQRLGAIAAELEVARARIDRAMLVDAVWRATWPHDRLLFASSRLVRVADQLLGGKKVPVHANRGLAGIDGTIATGVGIALTSQANGAPGVTRVLIGDLALLHDVGALLLPAAEPAPRIQVVVGNDGGGTIFDGLEVAQTAGAAAMDRVQYTPQDVDIAQLAAAYGWEYVRATTRTELDQALTSAVSGRQIVEVLLDR